MNLVTNEKLILDDILKNKVFHKKPTITVRVLIKQFFKEGKSKKEVREEIEKHMKNLKNYKPLKWDKKLDSMVKKMAKQSYDLIYVEGIKITQSELSKIESLGNIDLEKLAFVMLAYAKVKNIINAKNNDWVNQGSKMLLKEAKIDSPKIDKSKLIHELVQLGYITPSMIVDREDSKVNFVDRAEDALSIIVIKDFREIVYYYLKWKGEKIKNCDKCRKLFRRISNNGKYCASCKRDKELAWKRENMNKKRKNAVE